MPGIYYAPYGTQYNSQAEPQGSNCGLYPLGQKIVLPDGREYRYALAGAAARVAGMLYQSVVPLSAAVHSETVVSTTPAVGDTTISSTLGATLAAIDIYSEGFAHFNKVDGIGTGYRIRRAIEEGQAHAAVAASGVITVNLAPGETIQVAGAGTSEVSYTRNRFHSTIIHASAPTATLSGVANWAATASQYYYEQVKGDCCCTASGTLVIGDFCVPSASTDGTVMPSAAFETDGPYVGVVRELNVTAEGCCIDLKLD
jgi:hypothetical protein